MRVAKVLGVIRREGGGGGDGPDAGAGAQARDARILDGELFDPLAAHGQKFLSMTPRLP